MHKIKKLFCLLLIICVTPFVFVACNNKKLNQDDNGNDDVLNTVSTISLAEAKTIIVDALAISDSQSLIPMMVEPENRNLLEKLGKFKLTLAQTITKYVAPAYQELHGMSGILEYHNYQYQKCWLMTLDV